MFSIPFLFEETVHYKKLSEGLHYDIKCPMKKNSFCHGQLIQLCLASEKEMALVNIIQDDVLIVMHK